MKRVRRIAGDIIIICLIGILAVSGYNIYEKRQEYRKAKKVYEEIPSKDFEKLAEINPDVVAWLEYKPMDIDYPVVQGKDNELYLNMMFDGTWGGTGCPFVDYVCEDPFKQFNTIIYGHHMYDGSVFAKFSRLKEISYAEENPKFTLYLPDEVYDLEIWAFMNAPANSDVYYTNIPDEDKADYIKSVKDEAIYTIGDVTTEDRLVVLSTCAYEFKNARYVVICKMVKVPPKEITVEPEPTRIEKIRDAVKDKWEDIKDSVKEVTRRG